MSASATRNTYAGPLPERPVTASSWYSGAQPADRTQDRLGPRQIVSSGRGTGRNRSRTRSDQRHGVGHRPHDRDACSGGPLDPLRRDTHGDREHPCGPADPHGGADGRLDVASSRRRAARRPGRGLAVAHARVQRGELVTSTGDHFDHGEVGRRRPVPGEEPASKASPILPPPRESRRPRRNRAHGGQRFGAGTRPAAPMRSSAAGRGRYGGLVGYGPDVGVVLPRTTHAACRTRGIRLVWNRLKS